MSIRRISNRSSKPLRRTLLASVILVLAACASIPAAEDENFVTLSADSTRWYPNDRVSAKGNVQATYKDYKVTADSVEADLETNVAVFEGNVRLTTLNHTVSGERLALNLKTRDWSLESATSRLGPESFQGNLSATAFVRGSELSGHENDLKLVAGTFTTCDLDHPHYYINAKELDIYPGRKIVARKVSLVGLDNRLFTLNSMVIPIKGLRHNILPQFGSSAEEGMFLKTSYAYMATEKSQGFFKLDLMQKRGVGAGIEHSYNWTGASGLLTLYRLADREIGSSNLSGALQHQQQFGSLNLSLRADYRANNYLYYPSSTSRNYELAFSRAVGGANTALTFRSNSVRGLGSNAAAVTSLRHIQQFTPKFSGRLSMDMRNYRSSFSDGTDKELESVFELRNRGDKFDLSLLVSKRNDLDGDSFTGDDFYSYTDRLPELTFETDSYRLTDTPFLDLPMRLKFSAGRYHEEPSGAASDRLLLQVDMLNKTIPIGGRNDLNISSGFRQAIYAGNMAQQVLRTNAVLTTRYNDYLMTRFAYNYQRPDGYTPFRFDYAGSYSYLRAVMGYQDGRELRWSLATGYDLRRDLNPWQDLTLRLTANPNPNLAMSLSTGYDVNRSRWRMLISRFRVAAPDWLSLDVGSRYNLREGNLDALRSRLGLRIGSKWRVDGLVSWNGVMDKFDYRSFRITRDLHCWEASIVFTDESGFRKDKGIVFDLRLKAFPGVDRFGIGQFGQAVDTSMGEYYY